MFFARFRFGLALAEGLTAIALLTIFAGWATRVAHRASATFDEPGFMVAGYSYLKQGGAEISTTNLRAAQIWLAVPLLLLEPRLPEGTATTRHLIVGKDVELGRAFLADSRNNAWAMLRASRAAVTALGVIWGAGLYWWSRRVNGRAAGLVTLMFFCLNPVVLSNSALATTDVATALAFFVAVLTVWRLLHAVNLPTVVACGVACGLLVVTKISGLLLAPIVVLLLIVRVIGGRDLMVGWNQPDRAAAARGSIAMLAAGVAMAGCVAFATIWAVYGFRFSAGETLPGGLFPAEPNSHRGTHQLIDWALAHRMFPESFLVDVKSFFLKDAGRRAFLMGDYSLDGWWYFFPLAFLFKTPLPMLLALFVAITVAVSMAIKRQRSAKTVTQPVNFYELAPLVVLFVVYTGFSLGSDLNIGIRHLLPAYSFLFVAAGLVVRLFEQPKIRCIIVAALLGWSCWDISSAFGHPLSYMNAFAGGVENGHRILVDSSYDWGQDLPELERWLAQRAAKGDKTPVFFSYFGNDDLRRFNIPARLLPQYYDMRAAMTYPLEPGTYVISATMLHSVYGWAFGPWRPSLEQSFLELTREMQRLETHIRDPVSLERFFALEGKEKWALKIRMYDELRFGRLCAMLRKRPASARITPALLVYEVSYEDLVTALVAAPAELRQGYVIKGVNRVPPHGLDFIP